MVPPTCSFLDAHRSWCKVNVTERRTADDFAHCMRDLVDVHCPEAACIRLVLDNLSTHTPAALYQTPPACEARRVLRRLEFHYTPKHASCSTWSRSKSSYAANASTAASKAATASKGP